MNDRIRELPDSPGVYLFYGSEEELLYVGKARSIRKRVANHFSAGGSRMTARVDRIETLVTATEAEALLAEQSFIKRHRPHFNIRLRDDKSYPYVCVSLDEEYPRVYFTREKHRPHRAYFGPFSSAKRVRETLDLLGKLFQFRTCEGAEPGRRSGNPCLDYYIKRCGAPCVGYVSKEEYRHNIDAIVDFLSGRYRQVESEEEAKMEAAAAAEEFERAALHRDRLKAIRSLFERQRVAGGTVGTADLIGVAVEGPDANAQVFQVRDGILAARQSFYLENQAERDPAEVAEEFIGQYYSAAPAMPPMIVVGPYLRERAGVLAEALSERRGSAVEVRAAERGDKRRLRELAERNARLALDQDRLRREHRRARRVESLASLREVLGMEELPVRIEGFDISNIGGEHTVASMVVFEGGAPKKADYRRFRVRGDKREAGANGGPDDFASMEEVLERRVARYLEQADLSPHDDKRDESFASLPSLLMIDGGKGQLASGMKVLAPFAERGVTVVSLAKKLEEVYVPGRSAPLDLAADSEASRLLQRVRDEAHRFAIEHHRGRRDRAMTGSVLDGLKGIGPARKRALLQAFRLPGAVPGGNQGGARGGARPAWQSRPRDPRATEQDELGMADGKVTLVVITGHSGAGKSEAIAAFEDGGYFCVDNLPPRMIDSLGELFRHKGSGVERAAVVSDVRGGEYFEDLVQVLDDLERGGLKPLVLFLEADEETLLDRYKETRRRHPLAPEGRIVEGIRAERELLAPLRERADVVMDTSDLTGAELRRRIAEEMLGGDAVSVRMTVMTCPTASVASAAVSLFWICSLPRLNAAPMPRARTSMAPRILAATIPMPTSSAPRGGHGVRGS